RNERRALVWKLVKYWMEHDLFEHFGGPKRTEFLRERGAVLGDFATVLYLLIAAVLVAFGQGLASDRAGRDRRKRRPVLGRDLCQVRSDIQFSMLCGWRHICRCRRRLGLQQPGDGLLLQRDGGSCQRDRYPPGIRR